MLIGVVFIDISWRNSQLSLPVAGVCTNRPTDTEKENKIENQANALPQRQRMRRFLVYSSNGQMDGHQRADISCYVEFFHYFAGLCERKW